MANEELLKVLQDNPELKSRVESLVQLSLGKFMDKEVTWGDTAEELIVGELKGLGRDVLERWANSSASKASNNFKSDIKKLSKKTKKKVLWHSSLGDILVLECQLREKI